jgi:integrase
MLCSPPDERALPCDQELRRWHKTYAPGFKVTYQTLTEGFIDNHLVPYFGSKDIRDIREADLLRYIAKKQVQGLSPATIKNTLPTLRRVFSVLQREERIARNPVSGIGALMRRVQRASTEETREVEAWARNEAETLLAVAHEHEHEPRFAPMINLLFATGMRRGEAMGLKWSDVDFDSRKLHVRRSITTGGITTPKSGKSRRVAMTDGLTELLFDLLAERRQEGVSRGWREVPEWVFCSQVGGALDPRNVGRIWARVRRRALKLGVRPLALHCARHSWATWALQAGKNIRWVADQLGHADPAMTIRVYAHAMPEDETDLSFAEIGGPKRPYTALTENTEDLEERKYAESMARPVRLASEQSSPSAWAAKLPRERTTLSSASLASRAW